MQTLRRLQDGGIHPNVVTVLHPLSLRAADQYFEFYRDHGITHVSFSIDEAEGCHSVSSFGRGDRGDAIAEFLLTLLKRAYAEQYPLHIKEVERIATVLAGGELNNELIDAWQVLVVAANGDVTTFSPEFMEVRSKAHHHFNFGNILKDDFDSIFASNLVAITQAQILAWRRALSRALPVFCGLRRRRARQQDAGKRFAGIVRDHVLQDVGTARGRGFPQVRAMGCAAGAPELP